MRGGRTSSRPVRGHDPGRQRRTCERGARQFARRLTRPDRREHQQGARRSGSPIRCAPGSTLAHGARRTLVSPGKAPRKATLTAAGRRRPELPQGREHSDSGPGHSRGFEPTSACPSVSDWALVPRRPEEGRQPPFALPRTADTGRVADVRARTGGVRRPAGVAQRLPHRGSVSHFRQNTTVTHSVAAPRKAMAVSPAAKGRYGSASRRTRSTG
jgi:hypothetical protein